MRMTYYGFDGTRRLGLLGTAPTSGALLPLDLPPRSATLAVLTLDGGAPQPGFYSVTPCRVADTRDPQGPYGGPALAPGGRTFTVAGRCGIPAGVAAVAVNLTVTAPNAAGDLRIYPAGVALPATSAINFSAGQTRANNGIFPLDASGRLVVHADLPANGSAHFLLDVVGYFR